MTARRPVVLAGGRFRQLPPDDTLDVPAAWDALKTPAIAAGALALDLSSPAGFRVALNQNVTALTFAGVPSGRVVVFTITWVQDATGGRTVAFPANVKADGGGAPVQPAAGANTVTVQSFYTDDGGVTVWQAGSDSNLANRVATLESGKLDKIDKRVCTAWVVFDIASGVVTIRDAYNVSSVNRVGSGNYTLTFAAQMSNLNYGETGNGTGNGSSGTFIVGRYPALNAVKTLTQVGICAMMYNGSFATEPTQVAVYVFGGRT